MSTGPKQRPGTTPRGGARMGAGRPSTFAVSDQELKKLFKALKKEAKERGESWQENFAQHLFSEDWRESSVFHRMLNDHIKVNKAEKMITEKKESPMILPSIKVDPAKVVELKQA